MTTFVGPGAKLARATELLDSFEAWVQDYLDVGPFDVARSSTPEGLVVTLSLQRQPFTEFAVVIGDIVHNLRSALDHLAWEMVLRSGNIPRTRPPATSFPIVDQRRPGGVQVAGGVRADYLAIVDDAQPHNSATTPPRLHPLSILRELSNADKHRSLQLTVPMVRWAHCFLRADTAVIGGQLQAGPAGNDSVVGLFPVGPEDGWHDPDVDVDVGGQLFLALDEREDLRNAAVTALLRDQVAIANTILRRAELVQ